MGEPTGRIDDARRREIERAHGPAPGDEFGGRYRIGERLGEGGFGAVYRAVEIGSGRVVALKILREASGPATREAFERDPQLLRGLDHPGIARTFDAGVADGTPFVVSEFAIGGSLLDRLRREGRLDRESARRTARSVLEALEYLHGRGVAHLDVKPSNVVLTGEGGTKLVDYGLARRLGIPESGVGLYGTAEYLAPEQVDGVAEDHQADLYAAGVVLWEMLSGETPFRGATPLDTALARRSTVLAVGPDLLRQAGAGLLAVAVKALSIDRKRRFRSAREMLDALDSAGDDRADRARLRRALADDAASVRGRATFDETIRWRLLPALVVAVLTGLAAAAHACRVP